MKEESSKKKATINGVTARTNLSWVDLFSDYLTRHIVRWYLARCPGDRLGDDPTQWTFLGCAKARFPAKVQFGGADPV